eukprot:1150352-Pelagomonas_calceolata.AAC.1
MGPYFEPRKLQHLEKPAAGGAVGGSSPSTRFPSTQQLDKLTGSTKANAGNQLNPISLHAGTQEAYRKYTSQC